MKLEPGDGDVAAQRLALIIVQRGGPTSRMKRSCSAGVSARN